MNQKRRLQTTLSEYVDSKNKNVFLCDKKKKPNNDESISSFVVCPICNSNVIKHYINDHIDKNCEIIGTLCSQQNPTLTMEITIPSISIPKIFQVIINDKIPGLYSIHNFLTEEEESLIVTALDNDDVNPWVLSHFNGIQMAKKWGLVTDYNSRRIRQNRPEKGELPFPPYFSPILERLTELKQNGLKVLSETNFNPNEGNSLSYQKDSGHFLKAHFDDRFLSGPIIINISLCGEAVMTFSKDKPIPNYHVVKIPLPRRSLHIVSRQSRYDYTHAIANEDLLDQRRISIVLRQAGNG